MSKGEDIEVYLDGLERQLTDFENPRAEWRHILIAKLSADVQLMVQELVADPANQYADIKDALLYRVGMTVMKATLL